jgi:hypothetical protein
MRSCQIALQKILDKLDVIDAKVSQLPPIQVTCSDKLASTVIALRRLGGSATASQVSMLTGRVRARESAHLTELCHLGLAAKKRVGRKVVYTLTSSGACLF